MVSHSSIPSTKSLYLLSIVLTCVLRFIQFDKKWFKPDEASALRTKIRNTLIDLFCVSDQTDRHNDPSDDNGASQSRDRSPL